MYPKNIISVKKNIKMKARYIKPTLKVVPFKPTRILFTSQRVLQVQGDIEDEKDLL